MSKNTKLPSEYDVILNTPFGLVGIHGQGVQVEVNFLPNPASAKPQPNKIALQVAQQIEAYLQNPHKDINLPLVLKGTSFQRKVWNAISLIPSGQTRTYSELAEAVGSGPRAVANACGANHLPIVIPCHRVVAKDGLGGFMQGVEGGLKIKQWLLKHEGVLNQNSQFKKVSSTT